MTRRALGPRIEGGTVVASALRELRRLSWVTFRER
jgi:hypothetical protein